MPFLTHFGYVSLREGHHRLGFPIPLILWPLTRLSRRTQLPIDLQINPVVFSLA